MSAEPTSKPTALVSDEMAKKFATEKETPYTKWIRKEGLDIIDALYVRNLNTVELKPWARLCAVSWLAISFFLQCRCRLSSEPRYS